jgi:Zn-finger nucleic acid-binding protein
MPEARVYQCPVCGAFAQAGERTCRHCRAGLASLRCAACFELNFPDDLHCRGCGQELGLRACVRCGGQMVTHGLLRALLEQRETLGSAVPAPRELPRGNPLSDPVRYRPCPSCQQLMNRKNFGGLSGIIVDVCSRHGTFFDPGELPRVLAFVRRGGLAQAKTALGNTAATPASAGLISSLGPAPASDAPDLLDLLAFVIDVLRK